MSSKLFMSVAFCALITACTPEAPKEETTDVISIPVSGESTPSAGTALSAVLWENREQPKQSLMFAAVDDAIEMYEANGKRKFRASGRAYTAIDIIKDYEEGRDLIISLDGQYNRVHTYNVNPQAGNLKPTNFSTIESNRRIENICSYKSTRDGNSYVYTLGEDGFIEHWQLAKQKYDVLTGTLVRTLKVSTEPKFCVIDPMTETLYVAEEEIGIWAFDAAPEGSTAPSFVDVVKFGNLSEEVAGLAISRPNDGTAILLASNVADNTLNAYDINNDHNFLGAIALTSTETVDAVEAAQGLFASTFLDTLVVADDDNGEDRTNFKFAKLSDIHSAFSKKTELIQNPISATSNIATVTANVETAPVEHGGDAADDPAIWVHPSNPALSLVIGTNKQGGLYSYTLDGKVHQYLADGKMNNVDIRYGFDLNGEKATILAASNRANRSIALYRMNEETGMLSDIADGPQPTRMEDPYGLCMYQSTETGKTYVFINEKEGMVRQWELEASENGKVATKQVREFNVGSTAEGCVADDDNGILFQAEEDVALWAYGAEPNAGDARTEVTSIASNKALKDDLEGVSIYYGANGDGYLIQSSQGNNSYAVFDRKAPYTYRGSYSVIGDIASGIDGSSETDGLDVISTPLGEAFPHGLFIAQDGRNVMPAEKQNFKLVDFKKIADALNLELHSGWSPRR
ncbi:phytase [Kordiimonas sp. SCSIO 12603]|uniref:phytase n=1 Tax=Kordiimonas sp. SCSIO 12603 TaxID=2829596 RepID=UPI002104CE65|nr:phytase [Kordiimonas sp. SCSIO 12603]UTW57815.1 phytase [Kordiimonas sp. SCSIO 12603]